MSIRRSAGSTARRLALFLIVVVGVIGCLQSSGPEPGTLQVVLVDAPLNLPGIEAVTVTFSSILVHQSEDAEADSGGWAEVVSGDLPEAERTFNLLELVDGAEALLGEVELDPGYYSQMRVVVEAASITVDGVVSELRIPSGNQTGIKLTRGFRVDSDGLTKLVLDFDAERSVKETPPGSGNYLMTPVIRLVQAEQAGSISGTVTPSVYALITVYEAGTDDVVATTYTDPDTDGFVIQALLPGEYDIEASADGYDGGWAYGVIVTAGEESGEHVLTLTELAPITS
jgi:hypothetical protein